MIAIRPNPAPPAEDTVHSARETDGETTHSTRERPYVVALDDETQVIALD
jgi:hypothetical protein